MRSKITIKQIEIINNICKVFFDCSKELECYFDSNHTFFADFSVNIDNVPDSINVIPFICNVLPIIWLTDSELYVESLDKDFYNSIENFKNGYKLMYPHMKFNGSVSVKNLVDNVQDEKKEVFCGAFFSGGVDAFATVIAHIDEQPDLITVWGSDIILEDEGGWKRVWDHTVHTAEQFGLDSIAVKTNFRTFIDNEALNNLCKEGKDSWWHGFQHGIGLIGLSAPITWVKGYSTVYIASSFTEADKQRGNITCASDPEIDGYVRFCGCQVVHDQFEFNRQEKVNNICKFVEQRNLKLDIRVCYAVKGGVNCNACEKCIRTMMEIVAANANPENYGFVWDKKLLKGYKRTVVSRVNYITLPFWEDIKRLLNTNPKLQLPEELSWIKTVDIMNEKSSFMFQTDLLLHRIIGKVKRTFKF